MAINKKLKKFDTVGDYRNFLTTPDFEQPDVSSIGSVAIPDNIVKNPNHWYNPLTNEGSKDDFYNNVPTVDLEYNPRQMLFVNTKYYLPPTATTITPIIDTVTNGTIGCWYKQTTASTYTKLNTTDLVFYSAYTQNRIVNLTFNTIGFVNLKDDANVEYILSAKSTADVTVTATDNCIQRGIITLSASTFPSEGGSQNVYVKTATENPWEITNTNGWLAFSSLTGVGPTTLVVTASTNISESQRTGYLTIKYTDVTYSTIGSIVQEGEAEAFAWDDAEPGTASSLIVNLDWNETSVSESYTNTFNNLMVNGSVSWVTSKGLTSTSTNGSFTATTQENTETTSRYYTFNIVNNGNVVATIQIIQAGKPALYFYVGNTAAETTTSACTYASIVPTGSSSYIVYYENNYNTTEINSLTFNYDEMFSNASFVTKSTAGTITFTVKENIPGNPQRTGYVHVMSGSTEVARITVSQAAGNDKYFYWGNTGSATTTAVTATSAATSTTATYRTNYTTLTTGSSSSVITAVTLTNGTFTGKFTANSTYVPRTDTVTIYGDGVAVATLTFTQDAAPAPGYYYWGNTGSATTTAVTVTSAETSTTVTYRTNYTILASATTDTWITGATFASGTFTSEFVTNNTTSARTGIVTVKGDGSDVATFEVTQAAAPYFMWSNNSMSGNTTVTDNTTSVSDTYSTNRTGLTVSASSSYSWVTNVSITNPDGNGIFNVTLETNSATTVRTAVYFIKQGSIEVGMFTITQNGTTPPTYGIVTYFGTEGTKWSYSATTSGSGSYSARVITTNQGWNNYTSPDWISVLPTNGGVGTTNVTVYWDENTGDERTGSIYFYGSSDGNDFIELYQPSGSTPISYSVVTHGSISYAPMTGITSTDCYVTAENQGWTLYSKPDWVSSVSPTTGSAGNTSLTITVSANETTSSRSGTIRINGNIEDYDTISVSQVAGSGSPVVTYDFEWSDGSTAYTVSGLDEDGDSGSVGFSVTGYTDIRFSTTPYSWLTLSTDFSNRTVSYSVSTNSSTSSRNDTNTVQCKKQDGTWENVGTLRVEQDGQTPVTYYFYWDAAHTETATTISVDWDDTSASHDTYTNMTSLHVSGSASWSSSESVDTSSFSATLTQNSSTDSRSFTYYIYSGSSRYNRVGTVTITQGGKPAPPEDPHVTAVTITASYSSQIPCTGGSVSTGSVTYSAIAYMDDDTTRTPTVTASPSTGVTASSWGSTKSDDPRDAGTITFTARYTDTYGHTESDTASVTIEQAANPVVSSTVTSTGTTPHTAETYTRTSSVGVTYSISCSPTSETVNESAGSVNVSVFAYKNVPTSAYTYDTWYKTSSVTQTLCTGEDAGTSVITGSTIQCGTTSITSTYMQPVETGFTVSRNAQGWNSYTTSSNGITVNYDAYPATSTADRTVTYTFKVTGRTSPSCTFELTQHKDAPQPTGRYVTFTFTNNYFENSSHMGGGALTVFNMRFQCEYDNSVVFEATYDDGDDGLSPAEGTNYPDGSWWTVNQGMTQNKFQIWVDYGVTHADFLLSFDQISGHSGEGGMPISRGVVAYFTDSDTDVTVTFEDIEWRNE